MFKIKEDDKESIYNFPEILSVKLFFIEEPKIDDQKINSALSKRFDDVDFQTDSDEIKISRLYFFKDYEVQYKEGKIPAQGIILTPTIDKVEMEALEPSFQQSWNWREAESVVRKCKFQLLLTDFMSKKLDYKLRLEFFQKFVKSIVEVMKPNAISVSNGEKIMSTEEYLEYFSIGNYQDLNAFMNVRLFNIQGSEGEMIMDTLGLNSLGLPDFEIRFSDYAPSEIAELLFNYGNYIYEKGIVIENGNTIQGLESHQKWKCYFKESILEPRRIVIAIDN